MKPAVAPGSSTRLGSGRSKRRTFYLAAWRRARYKRRAPATSVWAAAFAGRTRAPKICARTGYRLA